MALDDDRDPKTTLGHPHHLVLERLAATALGARDYRSALQYSERRCRISPTPLAHCFVMRAEARWHLGEQKSALDDLNQALIISPQDVAANRRMMLWAEDERRLTAAAQIIAVDKSVRFLKSALGFLRTGGGRAWASVSTTEKEIVGWSAWTEEATIVVSLLLGQSSRQMKLIAEPNHPLSGDRINACAFKIIRPQGHEHQHITLTCDGTTFYRRGLLSSRPKKPARSAGLGSPVAHPTVIVPVYLNASATIACLDSVLRSQPNDTFRVLVVDDASPEREITQHLEALAATAQIELLKNPVNLGFVGAVNRAIDHTQAGDVILLNSDTLVPPGFVDRLKTLAQSEKNIGTVTPFSNNGEFSSFPLPNVANVLGGYEEVIGRDRAAAKANANLVVDLPSGVGFCLYISRHCLEEVGGLSEQFDRGYLEDVDFCLRAKSLGFRNVCAPSVYVGHHGSLSFGNEKRLLVTNNLGVLDRSFPTYRSDCRRFIELDPLKPYRAALERALAPDLIERVLITATTAPCWAIARARAHQIQREGRQVVLLETHASSQIRLSALDNSIPQSMALSLLPGDTMEAAALDLKRLNPSHLEIVGENVSNALLELAKRINLPIDVWVTSQCSRGLTSAPPGMRTLLAPTLEAFSHARAHMQHAQLRLLPIDSPPLILSNSNLEGSKCLAIILATASAKVDLLIRSLLDQSAFRNSRYNLIVVGTTLDDEELMSKSGAFVTGPVESMDDVVAVLAPHNVVALLLDPNTSLFGHPILDPARRSAIPVGFVNWSETMSTRATDLAIPMTSDNDTMAASIADWLEQF